MEQQILLYAFGSIFLVSLISLIGVIVFSLHASLVKHWLIPFVSLSAGTLLGAVFVLTPRALYATATTPEALWEQHLGGGIMLLVGGASYLAGGLWLTVQGLERREERTA